MDKDYVWVVFILNDFVFDYFVDFGNQLLFIFDGQVDWSQVVVIFGIYCFFKVKEDSQQFGVFVQFNVELNLVFVNRGIFECVEECVINLEVKLMDIFV